MKHHGITIQDYRNLVETDARKAFYEVPLQHIRGILTETVPDIRGKYSRDS